MEETVLFPEEMPPVRPTRNMILGVRHLVVGNPCQIHEVKTVRGSLCFVKKSNI